MGNSVVINWSYIVNYVISENMDTKESSVYETVGKELLHWLSLTTLTTIWFTY